MTHADGARPGAHPVDLDLLADYLAGELDSASARRVEALVAGEPAWSASLSALRRADEAVRDSLAGVPAEPMPDDVVDRLMAALAATAGNSARRDARYAGAGPLPAVTGGGPGDGASTRPPTRTASGGPASWPGHRRRGRARGAWLGAIALVAVALIAGIAFLPSLSTSSKSTASAPGAEPNSVTDRNAGNSGETSGAVTAPTVSPPGAPGGAFTASVTVTASGIDYTPATLGGTPVPAPIAPSLPRGGVEDAHKFATDSAPALERLADPASLNACLEQVTIAVGGPPTTADFARYQGQPAVIISVPSVHRTVAVGPDCGLSGSGADVLATATTP